MKKIYRNGLFMLAAGALAASCADYNVTDDFTAEIDPTYQEPYKDLGPVKSYIDRDKYANLTLGATLNVADFNKQELEHAVAVTNFDNVAFGTSLMAGKIINAKGVMNFLQLKDLLDHVEEIGGEVFGSPLVANANQADDWMQNLTAPIEIPVDFVEGKTVDFSTFKTGAYDASKVEKGKASILKYDNQQVLQVGTMANVRIVDGFEVDPSATYTATFWAKADKDASFNVTFSGNKVEGTGSNGKWTFKKDKWVKVVVESKAAEGVTDGYLRIENTRTCVINISKVQVGYYPDNHRAQTEKELTDTINYALKAWCEGVMKINQGRIKSFDLIDEPIDTKAELELEDGSVVYDLKHAPESTGNKKYFWQDILGSENYAPVVSKVASAAYEKYEGDPSLLKFFISETGLDDAKKFESLKYWLGIWDKNGAKIDGIDAKVSLVYSEDSEKQAANEASLNTLLENLASTGKLIRLSNFDIKYQNAAGNNVSTKEITDKQRQKLADYYAHVIKAYMTKISNDKQAGICKGSMKDNNDPVGLWTVKTNSDWVRNATYKAFCDALSGK